MNLVKKLYAQRDAILSVAMLMLFAKVLGFVKLRVIADLFGASHYLDLFWAAFVVPDAIYNILIAGTVNAALIPIFADVLYKKGEGRLVKLFTMTMFGVGGVALISSGVLFIFAEPIAIFLLEGGMLGTNIDPSATYTGQDIQVLMDLMRIMLISPVLLGLSAVSMGFLQTHKKFFITTSAPILYNIGIILGALIFTKVFNLSVYGLSLAVVVGSLLHFAVQVPITVRFINEHLHIDTLKGIGGRTTFYMGELWSITKLALPRILGYLGEHINAMLNTIISFSVSVGALSAYKFALSLHLFPVQIFAGSMSQVMLPNLAEDYARGDFDKYVATFQRTFRTILFLVLPVTVTLVVLRLPIVRLTLGVGAFDWWDTIVTSWALALLAGSVVGQSLVSLVLRAQFAIQETRWPLVVTLLTIVVNLICGYYFTNFFSHYVDWRPLLDQIRIQTIEGVDGAGFAGAMEVGRSFISDLSVWFTTRNVYDAAVGGLALSLSVSFLFEFALNLYFLNRKIKVVDRVGLLIPSLKLLLASVFMTVLMYSLFRLSDFSLDTSKTINVINVSMLTFVPGILLYFFMCKALGIEEINIVTRRINDLIEIIKYLFGKLSTSKS